MAAQGLSRITMADFSAGMFPALAPERIPANGCYDIENGLFSEQPVVYRRGGSHYRSVTGVGEVTLFWSGYLKNGGYQTIIGVAGLDGCYLLQADGSLKGISLPPPAVLTVPTVFQGVLYYESRSWDGLTAGFGASPKYVASAANRLLHAEGSRVDVSNVPSEEGGAITYPATNYFSMPEGVEIVGIVGYRTSCVVFTTGGIWLLGNLDKENVDAEGNKQWTQDRYSADSRLWGMPGVAAWKGALVIPCRDDIWLMELGVSSEKASPFVPISGAVQSLYRSYVAQGFTPGQACVFNGHYFLPILNGANVVTVLVCHLAGTSSKGRATYAWSRLSGFGGGVTAITSTGNDEEGDLIGAAAGTGRVLGLDWFSPSASTQTDADGSAVPFSLVTGAIPTGNLTPNLIAKARLSYRLVAAAGTTVDLQIADSVYGAEWGGFDWGEADWTSAAGQFVSLGEAIPAATADPEGLNPRTWRVGRKIRYALVRVELKGSASSFSVRSLELAVRLDGRVF